MTIWKLPILIAMFISVLWLAITVVESRHKARNLYTELHQLEKERDELNSTWSRFRLQKSTLLNHARIERQARDNLNMKKPDAADIKVIQSETP